MGNEVKKPEPATAILSANTKYFMPTENCTIVVPVDKKTDEKGNITHGKHHFVTVWKGKPYGTEKQHEIDALIKKGFKECKAPVAKKPDDE